MKICIYSHYFRILKGLYKGSIYTLHLPKHSYNKLNQLNCIAVTDLTNSTDYLQF